MPYAVQGKRQFYFRAEHAVVTAFSSRHIAVMLEGPHIRLFVLVIHCPSLSKHPYAEVQQFWKDRLLELQRRPLGSDFILLMDANSEVGSIATEAVSSHQATTETPAGALMHEFLLNAGGMLPSTFECHHHGPGDTWQSALGYKHRLDYIAVPALWTEFVTDSRVLPDIEALQLKEDHLPVLLSLAYAREATDGPYFDCRRRTIRPTPPSDPAVRAQQHEMLRTLQTAPWQCDVDKQFDCFVQNWTAAGRSLVSAKPVHQNKPYLSQRSYDLSQYCKSLRRYLRDEAAERRKRLLTVIFAAFIKLARGGMFADVARCRADRWLWEIDCSEASALYYLRCHVKALRASVRQDRIEYLQSLASDVALQDLRNPARLYTAVRKAFPTARSARRSGMQPLPAVHKEDGTLAGTPGEKAECWRQHFASQEAGQPVTPTEYIQRFNDQPWHALPDFDLAQIPSLRDLESIIVRLCSHKAAGPDSLTADLLKLSPPAAARQLLPVMAKTALALREPIEFRGGTLVCLAKKIGASLKCSQYRSILISSVPAKVFHRFVRGQLVPVHERSKPELQAGALGGQGIETIALAARTFQGLHHGRRRFWSIVYVDVQAAFYRVVRQSLYCHGESDRALLEVLHGMGLPEAAVVELRTQLEKLAILPQLEAPGQVQAYVQDMMQATWFRIDNHTQLTWTRCGTRPGDPAADMLFALSFGAFLRRLQQRFAEEGLVPDFETTKADHPWAPVDWSANPGAPAWADDFFMPQLGRDKFDMLQRTQRMTECTLGLSSAIGMRLTFAREKTAVLLPSGHTWTPVAGPHP